LTENEVKLVSDGGDRLREAIRGIHTRCLHLTNNILPRLIGKLKKFSGADAQLDRDLRQRSGFPPILQDFNVLVGQFESLLNNLTHHLTIRDLTASVLECNGIPIRLTLQEATQRSE
jgi:hypothetical protein